MNKLQEFPPQSPQDSPTPESFYRMDGVTGNLTEVSHGEWQRGSEMEAMNQLALAAESREWRRDHPAEYAARLGVAQVFENPPRHSQPTESPLNWAGTPPKSLPANDTRLPKR